jgi:hypothetical protein
VEFETQRTRRRAQRSQSKPLETTGKDGGTKIQKQTDMALRESQIRDDLRFVDPQKRVDGLQLDHD